MNLQTSKTQLKIISTSEIPQQYNQSKFDLFINVIIIFTATLHSVYFYQIKLAPFPIFSFLLLIFNVQKIQKRPLFIAFLFYFIFIFNALLGIYYAGSSYYFNSLLGVIIGPIYFVMFYSYYHKQPVQLLKAISISLLIHISFFYFQFIWFYLFEIKLNFLQVITGEESRVEGVGVLTNLIRCSGLCNEPASFSLFVNLLVFYLINIGRKINFLIAIALLSTVLSFSASGILFALINIVYFNIFILKGFSKMFLSVFILSIVIVIFGYFYFDILKLFFESRFVESSEDPSFNNRFNDGFKYFFDQNLVKQITGIGIGNNSNKDVSTVASGYMAIFVHLGYFFSTTFIIINIVCYKMLKIRFSVLFFFCVYLSSTMTFLNIHYWMFFAMTCLVSVFDKQTLIYYSQTKR